MKFALIGLHFLDYFTFVPPKGSCGLAAYIEALKSGPSQVRYRYICIESHIKNQRRNFVPMSADVKRERLPSSIFRMLSCIVYYNIYYIHYIE